VPRFIIMASGAGRWRARRAGGAARLTAASASGSRMQSGAARVRAPRCQRCSGAPAVHGSRAARAGARACLNACRRHAALLAGQN